MVIVHHAGQAYGPTGGFWPISNSEHAALLGPFFTVNAAFGMALFFLISGYFVPGSFDRKGAGPFLRDRFMRLGVPLVVFTTIMFVPFVWVSYARSPGRDTGFLHYLWRTLFDTWHLGHLWFLADLLALSVAYAAWRVVLGSRSREREPSPLGHATVVGFTLALAVVTFGVRVWFPIDRWVAVLGVLPVEPAHLARDASYFVIGILAYRRDWLRTVPFRMGMGWLTVGIIAAALCFVLPVWSGGGLDAASLRWSMWEAFLCTGLCLGLVVLFRSVVRQPGGLVRLALPQAYGAYLVHPAPILVLQVLLSNAALDPLVKFAVVSLAGVPLSFLVAGGVRRVPGMRTTL